MPEVNSDAHFIVQGAKAIAELLKKNSSLCYVELNNNMIDYAVWKPLNVLQDWAFILIS